MARLYQDSETGEWHEEVEESTVSSGRSLDRVELLRAIGAGLYGRQWQSALAGDLGINDRTMRRWVSGEWNIPYDGLVRLRELMSGRVTALGELQERLSEFLAGDIRSIKREEIAGHE